MDELIKKASEHIMFYPINSFLVFANQKAGSFMESIRRQDEIAIEMIKPLYHFGFAHVLVPLNELLSGILDEAQLCWWNNGISRLENYAYIAKLQDIFHEKAISYAKKYQFVEATYPWSFHTSVAAMEELLWDSYSDHVSSVLQECEDSKIGILIPGLYSNRLDETYIKLLHDHAFPRLNETLQKYDDYAVALNKNELAAIKLAVHMYARELGWRYIVTLSSSLRNVLVFSEEELANMRYQDYKEVVLCDNGQAVIASFLSVNWVHQLWVLTRYVKKFQLTEYSERALGYSMPVLMQCTGLLDDASEYLLDTLDQMSAKDKSSEIFLLALYRAVSVNRFYNRTNIISSMKKIFNSNRIPGDLIDVLEDILKFYKELADELPKRFQKETLAELIATADKSDKPFYKLYSFYPEAHVDDIEQVKWLYDCLFSQGQVVSQMEAQLKQAKNTNAVYSVRILHIYIFDQLFHALTSHINNDVRITADVCFQLLNIDEEKHPVKAAEIFHVYSYRQRMFLVQLDKRLRAEIERIPYYSTTLQFERIKFEGSDDSKQMIERIFNICEERIRRLELAQKYNNEIRSCVLKYTTRKDTMLNQMIMQALIDNGELTLDFCNSVHAICESQEAAQLPAESIKVLKGIENLLELAVSHPEEYQNRIRKDEFLSAVNNFCECIPVVSTISNVMQGIVSLKKIFDSLGQ